MADQAARAKFPINMRHQRMETVVTDTNAQNVQKQFPINRRHQGLATGTERETGLTRITCFQSIGVTKDWRLSCMTLQVLRGTCFQSIGVTKDWRLPPTSCRSENEWRSFQSIGVTKDWRRVAGKLDIFKRYRQFPINRRHQGLATACVHPTSPRRLFGFQSKGATKDWR